LNERSCQNECKLATNIYPYEAVKKSTHVHGQAVNLSSFGNSIAVIPSGSKIMGHNYRWFSLRFNHRLMAAIHSGSTKPINSQAGSERPRGFSLREKAGFDGRRSAIRNPFLNAGFGLWQKIHSLYGTRKRISAFRFCVTSFAPIL
jgi:hypothetical protein